jgi:hypothetical protein
MPARVRIAQVVVLAAGGLGASAGLDKLGVGTETDGPRLGLGSGVVEGTVAHDANTIAAMPSDKPRSAGHTRRRSRVMAQG